MALLNKLFSTRKRNRTQGLGKTENQSLSPFTFSKEQVRVLLFRECDWRGRKLLFDSKAVQKVKQESQTCKLSFSSLQQTEKSKRPDTFVEVTNGIGYQYTRPTSDITMLGEMMFGSVAMNFQGSAFKVHHLKSPSQLMCSKVFPSPIYHQRTKYTRDCSFEDSYDSSLQYLSDCFPSNSIKSCSRIANQSRNTSESCPLDVPYSVGQTIEVDSGFYGDASTCSISSEIYDWGSPGTVPTSLDSGRSSKSYAGNSLCHSTGSLASLQRRWLRNMSTSLEHENSGSSLGSNTGVVEPGSLSCPRRTKLGLALIITMTAEEEQEMQIFFFDHMVVIETMIERLWCFVARAYAQKETFVHIMVEGCEAAQQWLQDIFSAPRLPCPVWLGLTSTSNPRNAALAFSFIQDLCQIIANIDTKTTNFFVSTLLTAVLTHHLGWVGTVLNDKIAPNLCKNSGTGQLLSSMSSSHPYNPLWAQLSDLCGTLGHPPKIARTIVTSTKGKRTDVVNKILNSLTYFIRCGEVEKKCNSRCGKDKENELIRKTMQNLASISPVPNFISLVPESEYSSESNHENSNLKHSVPEFSFGSSLIDIEGAVLMNCNKDICFRQHFVPDKEKYYNAELDIKKKEMRFIKDRRQFPTVGLKGNVCSPAVTEWENLEINTPNTYNYISDKPSATSLSCSQLPYTNSTSLKNSYLPLFGNFQHKKKTCEMHRTQSKMPHEYPQTNHSLNSKNKLDSTILIPSAGHMPVQEHSSSHNTVLNNSLNTDVFKIRDNITFNKYTEQNSSSKSFSTKVTVEDDRKIFDGEFIEGSLKKPCGMKRTTSFLSSLSATGAVSSLDNEYCKMYPNLTELLSSEKGVSSDCMTTLTDLKQIITDQTDHVSKTKLHKSKSFIKSSLHVRKSAESIDLQNNINNSQQQNVLIVAPKHVYDPKKTTIDYQMSGSSVSSRCAPSSNILKNKHSYQFFNNFSDSTVKKNSESSEVIFVLGDDEKLVGLKNNLSKLNSHVSKDYINNYDKSENILCSSIIDYKVNTNKLNECLDIKSYNLNKTESVNQVERDCDTIKSDCNLTLKSCSNQSISENDRANYHPETFAHTSETYPKDNCSCKSPQKMVTVRSSVIELEDERGTVIKCGKSRKPNKLAMRCLSFNAANQISQNNTASVFRCNSDIDLKTRTHLIKAFTVPTKSNNFDSSINSVKIKNVNGCDVSDCIPLKCKKTKSVLEIIESHNIYRDSEDCLEEKIELCNKCKLIVTNSKCDPLVPKIFEFEDNSTNKNCLENKCLCNSSIIDNSDFLQDEKCVEMKTENKIHKISKTEKVSHKNYEEPSMLEFPLPESKECHYRQKMPVGFASSLLGGLNDHYVSDFVLQGCTQNVNEWEMILRKDLSLAAHHTLIDQNVSEAVCIVGDTDSWEVQLVSSHSHIVDKPGMFGVRVGMSQLVANMLESLLHLWKLQTPPEHCLLHLESKLRELCLRSQALADLLLNTEFCDMELLTSSLDLEANDVPLLLAVASTHSPEVTHRYGLSFR